MLYVIQTEACVTVLYQKQHKHIWHGCHGNKTDPFLWHWGQFKHAKVKWNCCGQF